MINIDGHTINEKLLTGSWVIDAGCRFWNLANEMLKYAGEKVYALDIENFIDVPDGVVFRHAALMSEPGQVEGYYFGDGSANFVKGLNEQPYNGPDRPCLTLPVEAITIWDIYREIGTHIDLLKLDIELGEYDILKDLEPIPRQVSVEFHEHTSQKKHDEMIGQVLEHMAKNYVLTQYPCPGWDRFKFMDCLFIRKDLL